MPSTAPLVTQTREPSESPMREITLSVPLPREMAKHPPIPNDPKVVIDLVPETVVYVKTFQGHSPRVGFVADKEAKNFFKTLSDNNEPFYGEDDYYYVAQFDSISASSSLLTYNEIWIFAVNERLFRVHDFNDHVGQAFPKCLQKDDRLRSWHKMDQADIPVQALTRKQCSETYCKLPKLCPEPEMKGVKGIDDKTITLKKFTDLQYTSFNPYTCHYDTAIIAAAEPLAQHLNKTGVPHSEVAMMCTSPVEIRDELDGKDGCQKFFDMYVIRGGGVGKTDQDVHELVLDNTDMHGFRSPKTKEVYHSRKNHQIQYFYMKCMGGNIYYEPVTTTATANVLVDRLKEEKKCFLGDHIGVWEHHPQSRLFDRFNEVFVDSDLDCSRHEGRPEFTFHLPLSKTYSQHEAKPVIEDPCTTGDCHSMSVVMRFEDNLRLIKHPPATWVCSNSTSLSCTFEQAWDKALQPILSYINGKNEDNVSMDITRPVYGRGYMGDRECTILSTMCMTLPKKYEDNPPKPIDDIVCIEILIFELRMVAFRRGDEESYWYQSAFVGKRTAEMFLKQKTRMTKQLDELKTFGVNYTTEACSHHLWIAGYGNPNDEEALMTMLFVDQQHIYWKDSKKVEDTEKKEAEEEERPDEEVLNLVPKDCRLPTCHPVHVTKEHSNYMEIFFPKSKGVCQYVKGCGHGSPRRNLFLPIYKYFDGKNGEKEKIGNVTDPIVFQVKIYSPEEELAGVEACEREFQLCASLPSAYEDKDIPKAIGENVRRHCFFFFYSIYFRITLADVCDCINFIWFLEYD
ncbi:Hypp4784 [Branchiostoma lanceolatum]|uniref:Hypp4784 protein n=1 Tax=Branchiostoma lanceolatum TaxID=7740 RepID=A0A8K0F2B4_BRALA|nr:Hypp4784 [Branchiostoma lanceolatum]